MLIISTATNNKCSGYIISSFVENSERPNLRIFTKVCYKFNNFMTIYPAAGSSRKRLNSLVLFFNSNKNSFFFNKNFY
jgi:hypothetical protein